MNHQHLQFWESVKLLYVCSTWWVVVGWALRWLTHTNVFLIFPVGAFGDKNYINTSIDASRRDTSTAVIGIANRARIKKLIFRILVIKSMKTVFTHASSEFWLFSKFVHTTAYCPIDLWRDGLKPLLTCSQRFASISNFPGGQSWVCDAATTVSSTWLSRLPWSCWNATSAILPAVVHLVGVGAIKHCL